MFLAWNEIRRNKLKFGLIIGVLTMISYLLFLLSGLANGLINMNKEGIDKWQADAIVLNKDANQTVQQSVFNKKDIENKYKKQATLKQTTLKQTGEIVSNGHQKDNVLVFGVEKSSFLVPSLIEGHKATKDNEVLADETLKNKGFKIGDTLSLSQSDEKLHIVGFTESAKYNASSVIFTNDATIAKINPRLTGDKINAVVVRDTNWKDKKLNQELEAVSINDFIENLPGYKPQNLTLNFMISFLFVISATVIGIFLYVMTLQKTSLFGILKAQGFTNGYLANVVISQTVILALFGTAFGLLLTGVTGAFLPDAVPVKFDVLTLLVFAIVLMIVSVLGSLFSILTIRKIDPLKAIG
ncbi:TPA: ABC transporter permease [Staphylococcus aureus]|nr:ABC transporter permease [Staphylococcus aureus]